MAERFVAAMDFLGILREKEKAELMKKAPNSVGIQEDQAGMNATGVAEAKYKNKNAVRCDGPFKNYFCEKRSFTSQLRGGLEFEEHCDEEKGFSPWRRTVNGLDKPSATDGIPQQLDLSVVEKYSNSIHLFPSHSGFGSPIEVSSGFDHTAQSDDDHDGCSGPTAPTIPGQKSGAQLTIFYSGTVNVYDDIPADKAQAIMLIASTGNYCSYPRIEVQKDCGSQITELKKSSSEGSGSQHQPASCRLFPDLPIARKHSLQRFLEKRKHRLNANAKSPYCTAAEAENTKPQHYPESSSFAIPLHSTSFP